MDLGGDDVAGAVSAPPFQLALDAFNTALDYLIKAADTGSANSVGRVQLVDYLHSFEQSRNRLSLVDHALIHAAEQQDLAHQLCQGSARQLLAARLRISKAEAGRRIKAAEAQRAGTISAEHVAIVEQAIRKVDRPGFNPTDVDLGEQLHDALEDICDQALRTGDTVPDAGAIPTTVIVTISLDDLLDELGYGTTADGTLIPAAKVLEMAEQVDIIPTVFNAPSSNKAGAAASPPAPRPSPSTPETADAAFPDVLIRRSSANATTSSPGLTAA